MTATVAAAASERARQALKEAPIVWVDVSDLHIDHKYQREISMSLVQRIAAGYNPVEPIIVSKRRSGKMFVINGQHRTSAAKLIREKRIRALVMEGLDTATEAE